MLAFNLNAKLTVAQYKQMYKEAKDRNCQLYPSYDSLLIAKKECYPDDVKFTETSAEVTLQSLLNHVTRRLAIVQNEVLSQVVTAEKLNISGDLMVVLATLPINKDLLGALQML